MGLVQALELEVLGLGFRVQGRGCGSRGKDEPKKITMTACVGNPISF